MGEGDTAGEEPGDEPGDEPADDRALAPGDAVTVAVTVTRGRGPRIGPEVPDFGPATTTPTTSSEVKFTAGLTSAVEVPSSPTETETTVPMGIPGA